MLLRPWTADHWKAPQELDHPPPSSVGRDAEALVGMELVPDGVMQAVSLPMDTHRRPMNWRRPLASLLWVVRSNQYAAS